MTSDTSLSARTKKHSLTRYAFALLATAGALLVGHSLGRLLGDYVAYVAVFPAIALSAWYCGLGPSIVSAILALVALNYWSMSPVRSLAIMTTAQALGMITFLVAAALILAMGEKRRRDNEALRRAQGELEDRVKQRTDELDVANRGLRELTSRLMQLQDDERRRIARELHDSIGQMCAALAMNLTTVGADIERLSQTAKAISDSTTLVEEMNKEVRTISYLLHPPLLDEAGLASALRWYIEGFSQRSKIKVDLDVPEDFGRLPQELETAVFRTVQECLTNIHRHSGSPIARIRLTRTDNVIRLQVDDRGTGVPAHKLDEILSAGAPGVGLRGMRERLRQLGGSLEIHSNDDGTKVEAALQIARSVTVAA